MNLTYYKGLFIVSCSFRERKIPREKGFVWHKNLKRWVTTSPYIAYKLFSYSDEKALSQLKSIHFYIKASNNKEPVLTYNMPYFPFQSAGIEYAVESLRIRKRRAVFLADQQGLGKTIEAIGVANEMKFQKLLIICPATGRLFWQRSLDDWHLHNKGSEAILTGKDTFDYERSVITSYHLAYKVMDTAFIPDLIILDEAHYLKNPETIRTQSILGNMENNYPGIVQRSPVLLLSGTPIPNGRPDEFWPAIRRLAPDAISYMKYWQFVKSFCLWEDDGYSTVVYGAKNHEEFNIRLRGSGFMIRRYKKDVLEDLPPKQFKMVVFPQNNKTRKIIEAEQEFSVSEIIEHGVPVGSGLPTLRREMGLAKLPQCIEYITDWLKGGDDKAVLFAHHVEVVEELVKALRQFGVVSIIGKTPPKKRQKAVDDFQTDPSVRVFVGNEAAEELITLTASSDLMMVEPEWTPGKNEQRADRLHRISQTKQVMVHLLVVERSLDARILSRAAEKTEDIEKSIGVIATPDVILPLEDYKF